GVGNTFGDLDDVGPGKRAERLEAESPGRAVAAHAPAAQPAAVGQRMFDSSDTPALLVEHAVVDDAADRQFGILLDGVVLEILVAPVAIDQVPPVGIPLANTATERDCHSGALDVERLVVFDGLQGVDGIERAGIRLDLLEEEREVECLEKGSRLRGIGTVSEVEREGLEARR